MLPVAVQVPPGMLRELKMTELANRLKSIGHLLQQLLIFVLVLPVVLETAHSQVYAAQI